jgi:serine/threonine-protein kinase
VPVEGQRIGRYVLYDPIASGGMASVHFGRMVGPGGFARTVVIKRLHAHLVQDVEFSSMFLDEGHLAARIRHPNVVSTIDVASLEGELLLVMEYVRGESLSRLLGRLRARGEAIPPAILSSIILGVLYGLEAAHEAKTEQGAPLGIVHRDISPQNVMVGADGLARVADFGVAKAASRSHSTRDGKIKGKLAYMAPEQLLRQGVDRRADLYAVGVILWEALAGRRLFAADDAMGIMHAIVNDPIPRLSSVVPETSPDMDRIIAKALSRAPADRFTSALEMAVAIETACPPAVQRQVGAWLLAIASDTLAERDRILAAVEASTPSDVSGTNPVPHRIARLAEEPTAAVAPAEATSLVTGLSVGGEMPPRRRVSGRSLLVGALLVGISGASLVLFGTRSAAPVHAVVVPVAATVPDAPSATAAPAGTASVGAPGPYEASVVPSDLPPAVIPPRPVTPLPTHPSPQHPRVKNRTVNPSCDPPFVVGSDGIERFKPGCL